MGKDEEALRQIPEHARSGAAGAGPGPQGLRAASTGEVRRRASLILRRASQRYSNHLSGYSRDGSSCRLRRSDLIPATGLVANRRQRTMRNPSHHAVYFAAWRVGVICDTHGRLSSWPREAAVTGSPGHDVFRLDPNLYPDPIGPEFQKASWRSGKNRLRLIAANPDSRRQEAPYDPRRGPLVFAWRRFGNPLYFLCRISRRGARDDSSLSGPS